MTDGPLEARYASQRCAPRLRLTLKVRLITLEGSFFAYTVDVSSTGLFVETTELIPVGGTVNLEFSVFGRHGSDPVFVVGSIARHVTSAEIEAEGVPPGLGIRFERFTLGEDKLKALISHRLAKRAAPSPRVEKKGAKPAARRFPAGLPTVWGEGRELDHKGTLSNVSSSGAFFEAQRPPEPGKTIRLWFELPLAGKSTSVDVRARVVWASDGSRGLPVGVGVTFEGSAGELEPIRLFAAGRFRHEVALRRESWRYGLDEHAPDESASAADSCDQTSE